MVGGNREFMLPVALMKVFSDCQYCTGAHNIRQACRVRRARHPRKVRCAVGGCIVGCCVGPVSRYNLNLHGFWPGKLQWAGPGGCYDAPVGPSGPSLFEGSP